MTQDRSQITVRGSDFPVEWVSRSDALHFVGLLNFIGGGGMARLPIDVQWEYVARAGTAEDRYSSDLDAIARWSGGGGGKPHPAGKKGPGAFGLHDMRGNLNECVPDWHGPYPIGMVTVPVRHKKTRWQWAGYRMHRGGSWGSVEQLANAVDWNPSVPSWSHRGVALRIARTQQDSGSRELGPSGCPKRDPASPNFGTARRQPAPLNTEESVIGFAQCRRVRPSMQR